MIVAPPASNQRVTGSAVFQAVTMTTRIAIKVMMISGNTGPPLVTVSVSLPAILSA